MGVRVRVRIVYRDRNVEVTALINTGYETDVPEIMIPLNIAKDLGLWPHLPRETVIETYRTASGIMNVYRVRGGSVYLIVGESLHGPIDTYIVVSEYVDEPLISDQLTSRLGIMIIDPARGLWRLR